MAVPTADELLERMFALTLAPKRSTSGDKTVEMQSPKDLLDAYKLLRDITLTDDVGDIPSFGMRFSKIRGPGGGGGYD
jgi:hypothetical protein